MIVFTDVETTGLDERVGSLLEVALVVVDDDLREVAATSALVKPDTALAHAEWVRTLDPLIQDMHGKSGLLADLAAITGQENLPKNVEDSLLEWLRGTVALYFPKNDLKKTPLAGSTVGFDRRWLREHMPDLEGMFSYRSVDASSLTELARRWSPTIYEGRPKADPALVAHRALADARESVEILRYYRSVFIKGA